MQTRCVLRLLPLTVLALLIALAARVGPAAAQEKPDRAGWMRQAKWGVMTHYLADWRARVDREPASVAHWNELIDNFDVEGLAKQLESVGAGYYLITIGQNSGYYLVPNSTYDKLVGIDPSKCSRRDLVSDLHAALNPRGIKLMVYLPAGAPGGDRTARTALQWQNGPYPNKQFQENWEQIIADWSRRWGTKVSGWWFDGCYWPNAMYRGSEAPNFESFAAAARTGNPDSAVAFNPGVFGRLMSLTPFEDYTAGEITDLERVSIRRAPGGRVDGAQAQVLTYLGTTWGRGQPRFETEPLVEMSRRISNLGAALTFDVPAQKSGLLDQAFLDQLTEVNKALRN